MTTSVRPSAGIRDDIRRPYIDNARVTFKLAHLTDPHLSDLTPTPARDLLGQRLLGYLSWRLNRRHVHRPARLERIVDDVRAHGVDHTVITGDLTHIGLPHEFAEVRSWLERLGAPGDVTVVPGNHDQYAPPEGAKVTRPWRPWFDDGTDVDVVWPTVRRRGATTLIGVNTAVVSRPGFATGRVGRAQLAGLGKALRATQGTTRVVCIHHSPMPGHDAPRKCMTDAAVVYACLNEAGAELILHGHGHRSLIYRAPLAGRLVPFVASASASSIDADPARRAAWHAIEIDSSPSRHLIAVSCRQADASGVVTAYSAEFELPA